MKRVVVLGLVAISLALGSARLEAAPSWVFTPFAGYTWFEPGIKDNLYAGARLGIRLHRVIGVQGVVGYSPSEVEPGGGDVNFRHFGGDLVLTPLQWDVSDLYLLAGAGYSRTTQDPGPITAAGTFEHGLGLHWWWSRNIGLNLEARNILLIPDKGHITAANINHIVLGAGLSFGFGNTGPKDADADGVSDRRDKCPGTPAGATVDATGCPRDGDGDGVFDGIDQCAGTPQGATVDARGCPSDSDGDKVFDGIDQCAATPAGATVDARGCPTDSDGDGVADGIDQCAGTPQGARVDARGCPTDSDNDGVVDGLDKCEGTAAGLKVDTDGCPIEVTEKETELLDTGMIRLQDVNFETGKADLLPESHATLDVVGAVLSKWPELRIQVGGHTDSRGANAYNQKLSEARAQSVLSYLTGKFSGLKAEQFTAVGFGESKPLVPNNNQLNMAKNRRVEFTVLNRDVLKREVERRKLLQK